MARFAPLRRTLAAAALLLAAVVIAPAALARTASGLLPDVALAELPSEAREVNALIRNGGPFRYDRDGVVFGNREKILPAKPRGHYHEYTVPTPRTTSRGARRMVCGGPKRAPEACYYSDDHYATFRRIRE